MSSAPDWPRLLRDIPGTPIIGVQGRRLVDRQMLEANDPPDFLFTSGRPGRFSPRGTLSIYASEDAVTAGAEWERYWDNLPQSYLLYFVEFSGLILDLGETANLEVLKILPEELLAPWRLALKPTVCQTLGQALAQQNRFAGIRFPSDAAHERGFSGFNYVLFKDAVLDPAKVEVRNDLGVVLQRWPELSE